MQIRIEGPAVMPLQTGFAQNWLQTTGELDLGPALLSAHRRRPAALAVQTIMSSPEIGASTVRIMYYLSIVCARRVDLHRQSVFRPGPGGDRTLIEAKQRGVDVRIMVSGIHNDNWLARQNSVRLFGRCSRPASRSSNTTARCCTTRRWSSTGCGRRSARPTSTTDRSRTTRRTTCACTTAQWARELHDTFLADARVAEPVHLETWQRRSGWERAQEVVAALLQEQT